MIKKYLNYIIISGLALTSAQATNLVLNGDFEANFPGPVPEDPASFEDTPNWSNQGTASDALAARRDGQNAPGSQWNAQINNFYDSANATSDFDRSAFGNSVHSQNTGYTIQQGDFFSLNYIWRDTNTWVQNEDVVRFVLFATDDNSVEGNVVWWEALDSDFYTQALTWESASQTSGVVNSAAEGQSLFVNFFGVNTAGNVPSGPPPGIARVDNIEITAIPEPGYAALIGGLAILTLIILRRRHS